MLLIIFFAILHLYFQIFSVVSSYLCLLEEATQRIKLMAEGRSRLLGKFFVSRSSRQTCDTWRRLSNRQGLCHSWYRDTSFKLTTHLQFVSRCSIHFHIPCAFLWRGAKAEVTFSCYYFLFRIKPLLVQCQVTLDISSRSTLCQSNVEFKSTSYFKVF